MKACPACRLINPPDALICDCGLEFSTGRKMSRWAAAEPAAAREPDERPGALIRLWMPPSHADHGRAILGWELKRIALTAALVAADGAAMALMPQANHRSGDEVLNYALAAFISLLAANFVYCGGWISIASVRDRAWTSVAKQLAWWAWASLAVGLAVAVAFMAP